MLRLLYPLIMDRRIIFPTVMFLTAGLSFAFGIWQYSFAKQVQASASQRLAFVVQTIEQSDAAMYQKQAMYAAIFNGLPAVPSMFGVDLSGSFASPAGGDNCSGDGQRTVCRALIADGTGTATLSAVCGACNPLP